MKKLLFLGAMGVLATGCPGDTCDTGDTACKGGDNGGGGNNGGGAAPLLMFVDGSCSGSTCTWSAQADGTIGLVELELAETGDPTATCGPGKELNECGFWEESHDAFTYTGSNTYGGDTFAIDLELVADFTQQVNNDSTLFDLNSSTVSNQLTVMFTIYDDGGAYADCAVYGHDVSWFASACTNSWN